VLRADFDPYDAIGRPASHSRTGLGAIPDQYGRLWREDDGQALPPAPPAGLDAAGHLPDRTIEIREHESTIILPGNSGEADKEFRAC
jgi:hypothetical protein